jgi:hypothetical protein
MASFVIFSFVYGDLLTHYTSDYSVIVLSTSLNAVIFYHVHKLFVGLIRRTACAHAQFSGCSSTTNAHSETGQMAVCCQNLPLGAVSNRSAPSLLVGELFKNFGLFLNTGVTLTFG